MTEIRGRFERLWQEGEPVSDRVVEQLRAGWPTAVPDPYLMCLKILCELYGDALGDDAGPAVAVLVELADFRQDAVATGLAMPEQAQRLLYCRCGGPGQNLHWRGNPVPAGHQVSPGRRLAGGQHEPSYCGQLRCRPRPAQDAAQRRF